MATMPRSLRIPPDVWTKAVAKAKREGDTLTRLVTDFLREYGSTPDRPTTPKDETP